MRALVAAFFVATPLACRGATPLDAPQQVRASEPARTRGIDSYEVIALSSHEVRAAWTAQGNPARLHCQGSSAHVAQTLSQGEHALTLEATATTLSLRHGAGPALPLAIRDGATWHAFPLAPHDAVSLATLAAVDVDFAIQGSALVWGASAHASCTLECQRAAACAERTWNSQCARSANLCSGCMVQ